MKTTRTRKTCEFLITEEWKPKVSIVPVYKDGFGWYRKKMFLGLYEWVEIKRELLPFDEIDIII